MARLATRPGGPRRTKVARIPFWISNDPQDPDSRDGEWRFLPVGPTHVQMVSQSADPDDPQAPAHVQGQYEAKGWVPYSRIPKGDERRNLLPLNYQEMMHDHKAWPQMPEPDKAKATA